MTWPWRRRSAVSARHCTVWNSCLAATGQARAGGAVAGDGLPELMPVGCVRTLIQADADPQPGEGNWSPHRRPGPNPVYSAVHDRGVVPVPGQGAASPYGPDTERVRQLAPGFEFHGQQMGDRCPPADEPSQDCPHGDGPDAPVGFYVTGPARVTRPCRYVRSTPATLAPDPRPLPVHHRHEHRSALPAHADHPCRPGP